MPCAFDGLLHRQGEKRLSLAEVDAAIARAVAVRAGKGDFSEYLLGLRNERSGCRDTLTFDRKLQPADGFAAL